MKIAELWRYPVKSMLGESVERVEVEPGGVVGDRVWAVVDAETGVSLSAKRYPALLGCAARTRGADVVVRLQDGSEHDVDAPATAEALSALLARRVVLRAAGSAPVRHEFPKNPIAGEGDPFIYETQLTGFPDSSPLHLITSATLRALAKAQPASSFAPARFRANFLVEADGDDFVENDWTGRTLRIGALTCNVTKRKGRCVMTTLAQSGLERDLDVLKTAFRVNDGDAGIELVAAGRGPAAVGDTVSVGDAARG